jgi:carbon-monoxide dehydrogenase small subunit
MPFLEMTVNKQKVLLNVDGLKALVDVLRKDLGLTGTKVGCREGECGSCTVLLDGEAINSCLVPAMKANGRTVITIEGLSDSEHPNAIQSSLADAGAIQCGICTPGFVMSAAALLAHNQEPSHGEIVEALEGNLCRCTGYRRIVIGILDAAKRINDVASEL